ncbi:MAG: hypothetical protein Q8928_03815 [Bacteroidota bacterium]|nr:hypothetical protein [Bacteroidota bacterium]
MSTLTYQSAGILGEATGYLKTLERSLVKQSRFNNDLLYNIISLCTEKLFVSLLASYGINATHHTPMALFNEAHKIKSLPEDFRTTVKLINKFESICSFDAFGYKTPSNEEIQKMIAGLLQIHQYVSTSVVEA